MIKFSNGNYKERLLDFIFERNWIELPLFHNNADDEVMRFDFESKSETYCANTIRAVFDEDEPYIIAYRTDRKYFDLDKYLADYFCDNPRIGAIFVSLKKRRCNKLARSPRNEPGNKRPCFLRYYEEEIRRIYCN